MVGYWRINFAGRTLGRLERFDFNVRWKGKDWSLIQWGCGEGNDATSVKSLAAAVTVQLSNLQFRASPKICIFPTVLDLEVQKSVRF